MSGEYCTVCRVAPATHKIPVGVVSDTPIEEWVCDNHGVPPNETLVQHKPAVAHRNGAKVLHWVWTEQNRWLDMSIDGPAWETEVELLEEVMRLRAELDAEGNDSNLLMLENERLRAAANRTLNAFFCCEGLDNTDLMDAFSEWAVLMDHAAMPEARAWIAKWEARRG